MNFILWCLLYPLMKFLSFLFFWLPEFQERKRFEAKNETEKGARSFKADGISADLCFEFSSEGEYQQVASLIDDALHENKKVELVFFSPSVEKAMVELYEKHPSQIRYLRYPLVGFSPFKRSRSFSRWMTSSELIMVRYDLFPEFLIWSMQKGHKLSMIWVTFKKERIKGKEISWFKRKFYKASSKIVFASHADEEKGRFLGLQGRSYDFRIEQIRRRVQKREEKFKRVFSHYPTLQESLYKFPRQKRVMIGNAWPSDLFLLRDLPNEFLIMIVPHQLTTDILQAFEEGLEELNRAVVLIDDSDFLAGDTFLLNKKGVLCELYADFAKAYVGGGFEGSVHSLLEPLVAGSNDLACGPQHFRSTEFDVAQDMGRVTELNTPEEFLAWIQKDSSNDEEGPLEQSFKQYPDFRKEVISC
jgi:3-deoxy-D-manno-octulosonic-acid transferase